LPPTVIFVTLLNIGDFLFDSRNAVARFIGIGDVGFRVHLAIPLFQA